MKHAKDICCWNGTTTQLWRVSLESIVWNVVSPRKINPDSTFYLIFTINSGIFLINYTYCPNRLLIIMESITIEEVQWGWAISYWLSSASDTNSSSFSWQASRSIFGATPAWWASSQRVAQRHQRSPGERPGKPYCGEGWVRSFPLCLENSRNYWVT